MSPACGVPALPSGLTYVEIAAGGMSYDGGPPERRVGRRLGVQQLWPVQRSCAAPWARLRRGRRGGYHSVARRSDGSIVAWGDNVTANATCRRCRAGSPTSRSRPAVPHGGAPQRRVGRGLGQQPEGQCNVLPLPPATSTWMSRPADYHTIARYAPAPPLALPLTAARQDHLVRLPRRPSRPAARRAPRPAPVSWSTGPTPAQQQERLPVLRPSTGPPPCRSRGRKASPLAHQAHPGQSCSATAPPGQRLHRGIYALDMLTPSPSVPWRQTPKARADPRPGTAVNCPPGGPDSNNSMLQRRPGVRDRPCRRGLYSGGSRRPTIGRRGPRMLPSGPGPPTRIGRVGGWALAFGPR